MRFGRFVKGPVYPKEWTRWWAWYPVLAKKRGWDDVETYQWAWLEFVEYKGDGSGYDPAPIYRHI